MPISLANARPRLIVLLSHEAVGQAASPLAQVMRNATREYAGQADISIVDKALSEFMGFARQLQDAGEADAFICSGKAGAFLRSQLSTPVILMRENGFDFIAALNEAAQIADRVAVFSRDRAHPELGSAASLLNIRLAQYVYTGRSQVRDMVQTAAADGIRVIIGSSMVTDYVRNAGLAGILSVSHHAARQAIDEALALCHREYADNARKQQLDTMLAHIEEGIVALDTGGLVQAINPAMTQMLGIHADDALGLPLNEVAPALAPLVDAATGGNDYRMINLGTRSLVVNCIPVVTQGAVTGAILKCQDTETVERADRRIRSSRSTTRFTARYHLYQILGESHAVRNAARLAAQYASTDSTVLITGETGTGKELLAQGIHNASQRAKRPFVAINCAALPETLLESELFGYEDGAFTGSRRGGKPGLFELAHTGTIFLDEIGDMPLSLQTRLLRVLQEQEVVRLGGVEPTPINVRIIAATHRDLAQRMAQGLLRQDLYYRINILRLYAPPLRERPQDIPELARRLAGDVAARLNRSIDVRATLDLLMPAMARYHWPGNVRELGNVVERAIVSLAALPPRLSPETLLRQTLPEIFAAAAAPSQPASALPPESSPIAAPRNEGLRAHLRDVAREKARQTLADVDGNHDEAARRLGISRSTLWRRLRAR